MSDVCVHVHLVAVEKLHFFGENVGEQIFADVLHYFLRGWSVAQMAYGVWAMGMAIALNYCHFLF